MNSGGAPIGFFATQPAGGRPSQPTTSTFASSSPVSETSNLRSPRGRTRACVLASMVSRPALWSRRHATPSARERAPMIEQHFVLPNSRERYRYENRDSGVG